MLQNTALIAYVPGAYVHQLVKNIREGILACGEIAVEELDLTVCCPEDAAARSRDAGLLVLATPEVNLKAAKQTYDLALSVKYGSREGRLAALAFSAVDDACDTDALKYLLSLAGYELHSPDLFVRSEPDGVMLDYAFEYGFNLGCRLRRIPNTRKPLMMKCLVCGEIFDASLGICPVCGAGLEQCVPVNEEETSFHKNSDSTYLILGAGIAGISAAEAIRKRDETGKIILLSDEPELPVNRPLLSKEDPKKSRPEALPIHDAGWYAERGLELRLNCRAEKINSAEKTVTVSGKAVHYDKLIYALGAESFVPPIKGTDKKNVFTLRHKSDLDALELASGSAKTAVVIGGGAIGLEAAGKLTRSGIKVTVLEAAGQIMERQVDRDSADRVIAAMNSFGCSCYEGVKIEEICGEDTASSVKISDGRSFPADLVLLSCGVKASAALAAEGGIATERGVTVNRRMETNIPDVYSCGDCAELEHINLQLWTEASLQGTIAGANAAGDSVMYPLPLLGMGQEFFGTSFYAIGDSGAKPLENYKTVIIEDTVTRARELYRFYADELRGAVLINRQEKTAEVCSAVTERRLYSEMFGKDSR